MNTQIVDGDEFMVEKEVIRLLYCNQHKWGDLANHYDLMHPIPQHTCKGRTYDRRSEEEQQTYNKDNKLSLDEQHKKTMIENKETNKQTMLDQTILWDRERTIRPKEIVRL